MLNILIRTFRTKKIIEASDFFIGFALSGPHDCLCSNVLVFSVFFYKE